MRVILISTLVIALLAPMVHGDQLGSKPNTYTSSELPYLPDQIIAQWNGSFSTGQRDRLQDSLGVTVLRQIPDTSVVLLQLPVTLSLPDALAALRKLPFIRYVEPNYIAHISALPNDTFYEYQWNFGQEGQTKPTGIDLSRSWELSTGKGVIIAVIDTGIAYEDYAGYRQAPDLAGTRFTKGYDFINDDEHANDDQGHGTHVAGTLAQSTDNGLGVAGIAFDATLMPIKALDEEGNGDHFAIASAIYFAVRNKAQIINMSFGSASGSRTLKQAVKYAWDQGVLLVAAAGNDYLSGNPTNYPAGYDDYCIAVAATRYDDTRAYYSDTGSYVDIAAPGGDLRVDQDRNGYGDGILQQTFGESPTDFGYFFLEGTSMATPHVSAVAALLMSAGKYSAQQATDIILQTARDVGAEGYDEETGWGIVDAWAALNNDSDSSLTKQPPTPSAEEPGTDLPMRLGVSGIDMSVYRNSLGNEVRAVVSVVDASGMPVAGVKVLGLWTGLLWYSVAGSTNDEGQAIFSSGTLRGYGNVGFRVRDLQKEGWIYDASLNANIESNIALEPDEVRPPARTQVGPSYPNPFNPETWIPYQLAEPANVVLAIYDANGKRLRYFDLGFREPGAYQTRSRAIFWDGTNGAGEAVASGIYFYRFQAGNFVRTGRMMLLR